MLHSLHGLDLLSELAVEVALVGLAHRRHGEDGRLPAQRHHFTAQPFEVFDRLRRVRQDVDGILEGDGPDLLKPPPDLHASIRRLRRQLMHEDEPSPRHEGIVTCVTFWPCYACRHMSFRGLLALGRRPRVHHPAQPRRVPDRVAVVRRGRLSRRLRDEPARAGVARRVHPRFRVPRALREPVGRRLLHRQPLHRHRHGGAGTVQPAMVRREQIRKIVGIGSLVVSLMISLAGSSEWMRWLQFRNGVPFGVADPILGYDIGFYVFRLPLFDLLQQIGDRRRRRRDHRIRRGLRARRRAQFHQARRRVGRGQGAAAPVAARGCFLSAACRSARTCRSRICSPMSAGAGHRARRVIHRRHGADAGGARADGRSPSVGARPGGLPRVLDGRVARARWRLASICSRRSADRCTRPAIQRFVVSPNEQAAETPYMTHNIAATRQAFNLAAVRTRNCLR